MTFKKLKSMYKIPTHNLYTESPHRSCAWNIICTCLPKFCKYIWLQIISMSICCTNVECSYFFISMSSWLSGEERRLRCEGARVQIPEEAESWLSWKGEVKEGEVEGWEWKWRMDIFVKLWRKLIFISFKQWVYNLHIFMFKISYHFSSVWGFCGGFCVGILYGDSVWELFAGIEFF